LLINGLIINLFFGCIVLIIGEFNNYSLIALAIPRANTAVFGSI